MPEDDIYGNKKAYGRFMANLDALTSLESQPVRGKRKYYCKNPANLEYFKKLHTLFERKDSSYIRRLRLFRTLLIVTTVTDKNIALCEREDIDAIVTFSHSVNKSPKTKSDFVRDMKFMWKNLFPEKDIKGRLDETVMPYVIRHLSPNIDKSRERLRDDRFTWEEFEKLIGFFSSNPQMQCYMSLAVESLGRPQELCYRKIADIEFHENFAKIVVSDHGKEGIKSLQCIDSFPYLMKWFAIHPHKDDPGAFLFIANGSKDQQLTPANINKKLRVACRKLNITKRISAYSLKRNGVTFARLRGDADVDIQHRAGWTSTKQLKTYDLSNGADAFKRELAKRGLINKKEYADLLPKTKECMCGEIIGFAEKTCPRCKRLTDTKEIKKNIKAEQEIKDVFSFALQNPQMSFVEIMDKFRNQQC